MKQALWANRWLLLLAIVLLATALWLSLTPEAQAQTGGRCTFGYVRYWQDGRYITEGRWFCSSWQTPRRMTRRR